MKTPMTKLMLAAVTATLLCLGAKAETIDLSELTADYTAQDGDVLTGETNHRVTIAAGATVTLSGVTINRINEQPSITCAGNATVVLADNTQNVLNGTLQVGPTGKTFTMQGTTGALIVTTGVDASGIGGPHDGGNRGSIVIEGGVITATGYKYGAGIGGGGGTYGCCDSVTITGGTITATGGAQAVGIGFSGWSKGGDIVITGGTVNAIGNGGFPAIGYNATGYDSCGNITIAKTIKTVRATSTNQNKLKCGSGKTISIASALKQTTVDNTLTISQLWSGDGSGIENDPYIVTDAASIELAFSAGGSSVYLRLADGGTIIEGPIAVPLNITLLSVDLNGGSITGATGQAAIVLTGDTAFAATGTGTISADDGIEAVKRQGSVTAANGVTITGLGGGGAANPTPAFSAGGKAATTEFVQGEAGKWTLTTFAELSNDALGADVAAEQIKVYAADTVEGLESASPMTEGVTVKEKKSAVKTTIEVTPPDPTAAQQFFKVKFGE